MNNMDDAVAKSRTYAIGKNWTAAAASAVTARGRRWPRRRWLACIGGTACVFALVVSAWAGGPSHEGHARDEARGAHRHASVPPEYEAAHLPAAAWTDPKIVARGKEFYIARCAVCHGAAGDGKGPAGVALPIKPPDLRDGNMTNQMADSYWFWRVSEGGAVEPFKSMGSAMPAWKDQLSVDDRWAVIAYQHRLSGHEGPHVVSEHAALGPAGHANHPPDRAGRSAAPPTHGSGHTH